MMCLVIGTFDHATCSLPLVLDAHYTVVATIVLAKIPQFGRWLVPTRSPIHRHVVVANEFVWSRLHCDERHDTTWLVS